MGQEMVPANRDFHLVHVSRHLGFVTKCSFELTDSICIDLAMGMTVKNACKKNGITADNYWWWRKYGLKALNAPDSPTKEQELLDNPYAYFYDRTERARAEYLGAKEVQLGADDAQAYLAYSIAQEKREAEQVPVEVVEVQSPMATGLEDIVKLAEVIDHLASIGLVQQAGPHRVVDADQEASHDDAREDAS